MEYYSALKKAWNIAICNKLDGCRDYHTKLDREKQILYDITYMWNQKNNTNESTYKTNRLRHRKQTYGFQRGKGRWDKLGVWD